MSCRFNLYLGIICSIVFVYHMFYGISNGFESHTNLNLGVSFTLSFVNFWMFIKTRSGDRVS
jgi:hypothetical protein